MTSSPATARVQADPKAADVVARYPEFAQLLDLQVARENAAPDDQKTAEAAVATAVADILDTARHARPLNSTHTITTILGTSRQTVTLLLRRHGKRP